MIDINTQNTIDNTEDNTPVSPSVYVVFTGKTDIRWLRFLRKNYRHCFVIMNDGHRWISVDPLSSYTDILVYHVPPDFDFPAWMEKRGYAVVKAKIDRPHASAPFGIFTCVEAVKRVLGIHKRRIITPYQLYRHLKKSTYNSATQEQSEQHAYHNAGEHNFTKEGLLWGV